jgi:hypothetical protein
LEQQHPDDGLITLAGASYYAGVGVEAIRKWVKKGYLPVRERDNRGRPLFHWRDVAMAEKARRDSGVSVPQRHTFKHGIAA